MSPLETSVTLDDVFVVVNAKRVPLAPELAGYLALEIAEGADSAGGDVDPKFVFIGEEGTVGLVRPKRPGGGGATGDAELSIRAILARLLEASGSQTPALSLASKRKGAGGLPSLVEELEAALIPVNRAAGRRALARLAREVKRVTLGVGRNASVPASERAPRGSSPSHVAIHPPPPPEPAEPPPPRAPSASASFGPEDMTSARLSSIPPAGVAVRPASAPPPPVVPKAPAVPEHDASDLPTVQFEPNAPRTRADSVDNLIAQFEVSRQPSDVNIGRELKAMIGLDPTPPPPGAAASAREGDVDALLALSGEQTGPFPPLREEALPVAPPPATRAPRRTKSETSEARDPDAASAKPVQARTSEAAHAVAQVERGVERQLPTGPSQLRRGPRASAADRRRRGSFPWLVVLTLAALALGAVAVWRLKPGFLSGRTQEKVDAERAANEAEQKRIQAEQQAMSCRATLVVTDVPPNAEVLQRVGQAPTDVDKMPVGTRLEFVATAEGYAPKRTVVPAGATWDSGPDKKPRFEVAVQLDKSRARPGAADLWPTGEPGAAVGGDGPPGTVHIVSTPKGAEIWLLVGVGPEARIEQLKCGTDVDVLVAGATSLRKRIHVGQGDFASQETDPKSGAQVRTARVSASASAK